MSQESSLISNIYRRSIFPVGNYRLNRLIDTGLPDQFLTPLKFLFARALSSEDQQVYDKVEAIRQNVACHQEVYYPFATSVDTIARTPSSIASSSSVSPVWGMFLYLCAKSFQARTILELGSSAGISGCYLTSAYSCCNFITIEGSPALASLATRNISQITSQARVVNGLFDEVLESILDNLPDRIDLVYIDGPKDRLTTLRYFRLLMPYLNTESIVIFDDIRWSREMWNMWQTVSQWEGLAYAIDVGRFGVGLWHGASVQPRKIDLSFLTGWWRIKNGFDAI